MASSSDTQVSGKTIKTGDLSKLTKNIRLSGKKIVFTYGTFDLIHSGHALYLIKAKAMGDILIVGVSSNKSKLEMRGRGFPLIDQKNRAELLNYFDFVDYTTIVDERNLLPILKKIKPDVFYTLATDWKSHLRKSEEEEYVRKYGGSIIKNQQSKPFISAGAIVERVADLKIKEVVEYFFGKINIDLSSGDWRKTRWSGLKTRIRSDTLHFGDHSKYLNLFSRRYFGEIIDRNQLVSLGEKLRKSGKKIVLSSGACDLLHAGHARFYSSASNSGDVLVLALPSNKIIKKQKGRGRPIVHEYSRAELMGFFPFVDYIVIFDDESVIPLIKDLKPDVFFTVKEDWNEVGQKSDLDIIKEWGGRVVSVPPQSPKLSSSKLIRKAAGIRIREVFKEVLDEAEKWSALKD